MSARMVICTVRSGFRRSDAGAVIIIEDQMGSGDHGTSKKNCVEVKVSDSGIGIKQEDMDRIFLPYEQVDGSASRKYQGTGLGLSLTRSLVELHGGRLWVESEGNDKGSTFGFVIPV